MKALDALQPHTHALIRVDVVKLMDKALYLPSLDFKEMAFALAIIADIAVSSVRQMSDDLDARKAKEHISLDLFHGMEVGKQKEHIP